ncbi:unnamed protein product [Arctogadus glacialis]
MLNQPPEKHHLHVLWSKGPFSLAVAPPVRGHSTERAPAMGLVGEDPDLELNLKRWRLDWVKHMSRVDLSERGQLLIGQVQRGGVW